MKVTNFTLYSDDIQGQATDDLVFNDFGCSGQNQSPQLSWKNAPEDTKSFAVTLYDPDAPTGSGWWHWLVFNLPATTDTLPKGAGDINLDILPKQVIQSINDYSIYGYGGPCPPQGDKPHAYILTVYALSIPEIPLDKDANAAKVGFYINQNTIAKASLIFYHERCCEDC